MQRLNNSWTQNHLVYYWCEKKLVFISIANFSAILRLVKAMKI